MMAHPWAIVAGMLMLGGAQGQNNFFPGRDRSNQKEVPGFLTKYTSSGYDKFITPNLQRVKPGLTSATQVQDSMAADDSSSPITLSAIGIGLLSLATMLGIRLRVAASQSATIPASSAALDLPMNTSSALGDTVMEMKSQDPNVQDAASMGWGQLSSQNTGPLTPCYVHRPQLKAAKKANRKRPKKKMLSDINRKPPPYNVEPQFYEGRPDEYVVEVEGSDDFDKNAHIAKVLADLEAQADYDNTDTAEEEKIMAAVKYPDPAVAAVAMAK
jgi:hypothetical protein